MVSYSVQNQNQTSSNYPGTGNQEIPLPTPDLHLLAAFSLHQSSTTLSDSQALQKEKNFHFVAGGTSTVDELSLPSFSPILLGSITCLPFHFVIIFSPFALSPT
jgi:hypothetical protein